MKAMLKVILVFMSISLALPAIAAKVFKSKCHSAKLAPIIKGAYPSAGSAKKLTGNATCYTSPQSDKGDSFTIDKVGMMFGNYQSTQDGNLVCQSDASNQCEVARYLGSCSSGCVAEVPKSDGKLYTCVSPYACKP